MQLDAGSPRFVTRVDNAISKQVGVRFLNKSNTLYINNEKQKIFNSMKLTHRHDYDKAGFSLFNFRQGI